MLAQFWVYGQAQDKHVYDIDVPAEDSILQSVSSASALQSGGKTPLSNGQVVDHVVAASQPQRSGELEDPNGTIPPSLSIFYGDEQKFGHIGNPQRQINVLGNLKVQDNLGTLQYSLNGSQLITTNLGPDRRRLGLRGDFNIELPYTDLKDGVNEVEIIGKDQFNQSISTTVEIDYTSGQQWPLPYTADWSAASEISDVAQVVDGEWALTSTGIKPLTLHYDRLVGMGDSNWRDYEVTVPITVTGIDEMRGFQFPSLGPGIGLIMDWNGHFQQVDERPFTGWQEFGAIGWYRWSKTDEVISSGLQMLTYYGEEEATDPTVELEFGIPYMVKMSTQRQADETNLYRYKMWKMSEPEPNDWNMVANGDPAAATSGSMLLVAHHVDVEFGTVNAKPLSSIKPGINLSVTGNGTVTFDPDLTTYAYGQIVTVTASALVGQIVEWGGALQGNVAIQQLELTKDVDITANFVSAEPQELDLSTVGNGRILVDPIQDSYAVGTAVTLTALADGDSLFTGWSGALTGIKNPISYIVLPGKQVTATFTERSKLTPPISDDFNSCTIDNNLWTVTDPVGDSTVTQNGTQITISVPEASDHDLWKDKNLAPRMMQPMIDGDFRAEVKFQNIPQLRFQTQGIIIEEDADNFLRFDVFHDGSDLRLFAAILDSTKAQPTVRYNQPLSEVSGSEIYIQVEHFDDRWRLYYSFDGDSWVGPVVNFTHTLTVKQAGFFAGNTGDLVEDVPAFETSVDYFYNSLAPITPEDYYTNQIIVTTEGSGSGAVDISSPKSGNTVYTCGESVTLTAKPDSNAAFVGWRLGDTTSTDNPLTVSITGGRQAIIAEFEETGQDTFLPLIFD